MIFDLCFLQLEVTAAQEADQEAERLSREDHAKEITKWRSEKKKNKVMMIEKEKSNAGFFSKFLDFWRKPKLA